MTTVTAQTIAAALGCSRSGCECTRLPRAGTWRTHCPAHHPDTNPSLDVIDGDSKLLVICRTGCSQDVVVAALKARELWPTPEHVLRPVSRVSPLEGPGGKATAPPTGVTPPAPTGDMPVRSGLTLEMLAAAKGLPVDFLRSLGLSTVTYPLGQGQKAVKMLYLDEGGGIIATRFRLALDGKDRFRHKAGGHVQLYGRSRLAQPAPGQSPPSVLVVEGESDCWTAWHCGLLAVGVPGKGTWRPEWAKYLDSFQVYIWEEPEAEGFTERIAKNIPDAKVIIAPSGTKDLSEAHVRGDDVKALVERLSSTAVPVKVLLKTRNDAALAGLEELAGPVLDSTDILGLVDVEAKRLRYGGDTSPVKVVYLAATTRLLLPRLGGMVVHIVLIGPPGACKSFTWKLVLLLLPDKASHVIDAGSPRALIYDTEDLQHRVLVFGEADSLPAGEDNSAASAIRNLLQDGQLHYDVAVRDEQSGEYVTKKVRKPGPTALITTAVKPLGEQLMSRLFTVDSPHDQAQIRNALMAQAQAESDGELVPSPGLIAAQEYLQLLAPWRVEVPYAQWLAANIGYVDNPRILRDFSKLLSLIKANAILHHRHREVRPDGQVVATPEDYHVVHALVSGIYESSASGASRNVREVVQAVEDMRKDWTTGKRLTQAAVIERTELGAMAVQRAVRDALREGWLINNTLSQRSNRVYDLAVGEALPPEQVLPAPNALAKDWISNTLTAATGEPTSVLPLEDRAESLQENVEAPVGVGSTNSPSDERRL